MGKTKATILMILGVIINTQFMYGNNKIVDNEFKKFWSDFQAAIKSNDREKVSEYFNFPFYNENDENIYLSKSQFIKYYNFLITVGITKKNSLKKVMKNDDVYSYEEWGNGTSDNCEYRLNITKVNGNYKATSLYIRYYDFDNWIERFDRELSMDEFNAFFGEFKSALAKNDKNKIADMIQFPGNDFSYFSYPTECITNNKDNFLKCYDRIFGKEMRNAFKGVEFDSEQANTKRNTFQKLNKGEAEYLIYIHIGETLNEFYFTRINGRVLLFKIDVTGL